MDLEIITYDIIDSTNTEALKLAREGEAEGTCILAREQTAGRGRLGRKWVSEKDAGLYFSIILRPEMPKAEFPLITLMAGAAVHDALGELGISADIKWVNDIHVGGKKISGILTETTATPNGTAAVVGIGVNLLPSNFPPEIADLSTSVQSETGRTMTGAEFAEILVKYLGYFYGKLQAEKGGSEIINEWRKRSTYFSGKKVKAKTGTETVFGVTDGLEPNGALRIMQEDGTLAVISAGDVEQLRADSGE